MPSVTRKSQSNRARRRAEIEVRLLSAVEKLLADGESYTEISVERLVTEADLSRSTFYVYFEDKGDLLQTLTEDVISDFMEAAGKWWNLPAGASRDDVAAGLRELVEVYRPHGILMGAVVDASSYDPGVRERFGEMLMRSIGEVERHIREGQKAGTIRKELDPEATASWLTWMTERGLYQLVRGADDERAKVMAEALTGIIWNTLYEGV
jgi:TetR/AcrR family transcriptional regulator, ethionamide resistance regulator